jgi:hypothetical protein
MWYTWLFEWLVICKEWVRPLILRRGLQITNRILNANVEPVVVVNHFLDCHNADHSTLKFMLIAQRDDDLREGENFWIGMLLTNQGGLNSHHDFVQQ